MAIVWRGVIQLYQHFNRGVKCQNCTLGSQDIYLIVFHQLDIVEIALDYIYLTLLASNIEPGTHQKLCYV